MQAGLEALEQRAGADIARARKDAPLMAGSHPCAVPDCITPAKIGQLMCRGHWFMVSQKTRRAVNATWRNFKKRSEEHTSELQSLMRSSYAVFCLKKKKNTHKQT